MWCSENFDSTKQPSYSGAALTAPSSDPCSIYKLLKADIERSDIHSAKITQVKTGIESAAIRWSNDGEITADEAAEIFYMIKTADFRLWRPIVYIIPRVNLESSRVQLVAPEKRASLGVEYIVPDLDRNEFDMIEL